MRVTTNYDIKTHDKKQSTIGDFLQIDFNTEFKSLHRFFFSLRGGSPGMEPFPRTETGGFECFISRKQKRLYIILAVFPTVFIFKSV